MRDGYSIWKQKKKRTLRKCFHRDHHRHHAEFFYLVHHCRIFFLTVYKKSTLVIATNCSQRALLDQTAKGGLDFKHEIWLLFLFNIFCSTLHLYHSYRQTFEQTIIMHAIDEFHIIPVIISCGPGVVCTPLIFVQRCAAWKILTTPSFRELQRQKLTLFQRGFVKERAIFCQIWPYFRNFFLKTWSFFTGKFPTPWKIDPVLEKNLYKHILF